MRLDIFINPQLTYKKLLKEGGLYKAAQNMSLETGWPPFLRLRSVQVGLVLHPAERMALSWLIGASTKRDYTTSEMVPFSVLNYT